MSEHILKVDRFFVPENIEKKRDCYEDLMAFVEKGVRSSICALYGLRRTGKTVLMEQAAQNLDERGIPCYRLVCTGGGKMSELLDFLQEAYEQGVKHVFVDEITMLDDFQAYPSALANVYAAQGMRIVVAGTDSLGIALAAGHPLLDRVKKIHTSYIPYGEYHRLLGGTINDFIAYGGTLTNNAYKEGQDTSKFYGEYYNSAIVDNILNSLEKNEGTRRYPPELTELYERQEIVSSINRMIGVMNQMVTAKAISREFESDPLKRTIHNMDGELKRNDTVRDFRYRDVIDIDRVKNAVREALRIKTNLEMSTKLSEGHLRQLKGFLEELGLLLVSVQRSSLKDVSVDTPMEIILQPGMVYAHVTELRKVLEEGDSWKQIVAADGRDDFIRRADRGIKGVILEDAVLANCIINYQDASKLYVSKYNTRINGRQHEADMIIVDKAKDESYVFEVKFSEGVYDSHLRHLIDQEFAQNIKENFGDIVGRYLIYNGPTGVYSGVNHVNVDDFFNAIYYHRDNWKEALRAIDGLSFAGGLLEPCAQKGLNDKIADAVERAGEAPWGMDEKDLGK